MKEKRTDKILTFRSGELIEVEDSLAIEGKLNVLINGKQAVSLYCTPTKLRELAIGFVLTEGIAEGVCTERMTLMYSDDGATVEMHAEGEVSLEGGTVTSGCVGGMTFGGKERENAHDDPLKVKISDIQSMMKRFTQKEGLYTETGCAHRAALMHGDDVISYAEDIGRHNAVDKVIGGAILEGVDFKGKVLLSSGRLSSEIVSKCAGWGIPLVVSRAAPTARAVEIARESGVTLIGFMRGSRYNIYSHPHRVLI